MPTVMRWPTIFLLYIITLQYISSLYERPINFRSFIIYLVITYYQKIELFMLPDATDQKWKKHQRIIRRSKAVLISWIDFTIQRSYGNYGQSSPKVRGKICVNNDNLFELCIRCPYEI